MERVNIKQLCEQYNSALKQNQGKKFTSSEIKEVLKSFGISGSMIKRIIASEKLLIPFKYEGVGKGNFRGYSFPEKPRYIEWFQNWLYPPKKEIAVGTNPVKISEQQAWETLVNAGVIKTKFNLNTLKTKYPKIYLECLEYELNTNK